MKETHKIKDLETVRLLADPLKLELLQAFAEGDKTTKEAAMALDQSVTKLYRHVDALHDAGLLEIVRETRKRGTVERTFRAVAKRFEADHSLFIGDAEEGGQNAIRDLLRAGEVEILEALGHAESADSGDIIVSRMRVKGTPERIAELRRGLVEWLESVHVDEDEDDGEPEEFAAMIAFYPISTKS